MNSEDTKLVAADLLEALRPLEARSRAMFGGYCVYVDEKVVALVVDGTVFVKRSARDDLFDGWAVSDRAYPGAKESWRLPPDSIEIEPDRVRDAFKAVGDALPHRRKR